MVEAANWLHRSCLVYRPVAGASTLHAPDSVKSIGHWLLRPPWWTHFSSARCTCRLLAPGVRFEFHTVEFCQLVPQPIARFFGFATEQRVPIWFPDNQTPRRVVYAL